VTAASTARSATAGLVGVDPKQYGESPIQRDFRCLWRDASEMVPPQKLWGVGGRADYSPLNGLRAIVSNSLLNTLKDVKIISKLIEQIFHGRGIAVIPSADSKLDPSTHFTAVVRRSSLYTKFHSARGRRGR
jgi:hypothetical protein